MISLNKVDSVTVLRLEDTVVERRIPMTQEGCDALRAIRDVIANRVATESGESKVIVPFPTVIHLVLLDYANMVGIDITPKEKPDAAPDSHQS